MRRASRRSTASWCSCPSPRAFPPRARWRSIRGWADSLALTAACHDVKLHARLAPKAGPARAVFEAVERARVEALGANRMPGMAANLTARVEDQYGHGRYAEITERADAPLEDALSLIVRERLTGAAPPETAKAMVDLWRPWIEERAGRTLSRMDKLSENQETVRPPAARPPQGARPVRGAVRGRARGRRGRRAGLRGRRAERRGLSSEGQDSAGPVERGPARRGRGRRDHRDRPGRRYRPVRRRCRRRGDGRRARAVAAQLQRPR